MWSYTLYRKNANINFFQDSLKLQDINGNTCTLRHQLISTEMDCTFCKCISSMVINIYTLKITQSFTKKKLIGSLLNSKLSIICPCSWEIVWKTCSSIVKNTKHITKVYTDIKYIYQLRPMDTYLSNSISNIYTISLQIKQ